MRTRAGRPGSAALAALGLALAAAAGGVGLAHAHADYARSEPGAGAVVATPPERVDIWFTQDMFRRQGENWIEVTGPDGAAVLAGQAQIDDDDRRHLGVTLQANLAPGVYTVAWRTLSADDGDDHVGSFSFTLDPRAQVTSTPMLAATATTAPATTPAATAAPATPTPSGRGGCAPGLAPIAGAVGLVLVVGRRRRPQAARKQLA